MNRSWNDMCFEKHPLRKLWRTNSVQGKPYKFKTKTAQSFSTIKICKIIHCKLSIRKTTDKFKFSCLNAKLNPNCHLLALLGAHRILHISRVRVKGFCSGILHSGSLYAWSLSIISYPKTIHFRNWIWYCPQVQMWGGGQTYLLGWVW